MLCLLLTLVPVLPSPFHGVHVFLTASHFSRTKLEVCGEGAMASFVIGMLASSPDLRPSMHDVLSDIEHSIL